MSDRSHEAAITLALCALLAAPWAALAEAPSRGIERLPPDVGFGVRATTEHAWGQAVLGITLEGDRRGPARVAKVKRNSPAEEAGLRKGDIILELSDKRIRNYRDVQRIIDSFLPNDLMQIVIDRGGNRRRLTAILAGAPPPSRVGEYFNSRIHDDARH